MTNVLLLLNDTFVTLPNAEDCIIDKKSIISNNHQGSKIDQYVLSNIILNNVKLSNDYYDFIYFIDSNGEFNYTIPNNLNIKNSLKTSQSINLNRNQSSSSISKIGTKLSKLKFKKLNQKDKQQSSSNPTTPISEIEINPSSPPELSPLDNSTKLKIFGNINGSDNDNNDDDDDFELIDENELIIDNKLLNESSIICLREPNSNNKKRRKACKDCTCGLAELESSFQINNEQNSKSIPKSLPKIQFNSQELNEIDFTIEGKTGGCGSCSLGDAFRCDGCPYLGLPAFKPGQVISLDGISDDL
ncbi:hypothetical protein WICMUC_003458 [Wickerhamomyces mucosus]|uniref:Anamorsin C-terminal domain-containing protein n=1 Tax=Wickerhamomyces mucosus TaxID=1378264 RepID=A0A9P8PLG1_9ASCO|nr:hypothetical protein WICMUC_003458 [Wickerhamomyces mucosus]